MNRFDEDDLDRTLDGLRREPPPFAEGDYASMRRAVRRRVEARPGGFGLAWGWSLGAVALAASALVAALLVVRVPRPAATAQVAVTTPPARPESARVFDELPLLPIGRLPALAPARRPHPAIPRAPDAAPVKIEFQTANPDVRIIWLAKPGEAPPRRSARAETEEVS